MLRPKCSQCARLASIMPGIPTPREAVASQDAICQLPPLGSRVRSGSTAAHEASGAKCTGTRLPWLPTDSRSPTPTAPARACARVLPSSDFVVPRHTDVQAWHAFSRSNSGVESKRSFTVRSSTNTSFSSLSSEVGTPQRSVRRCLAANTNTGAGNTRRGLSRPAFRRQCTEPIWPSDNLLDEDDMCAVDAESERKPTLHHNIFTALLQDEDMFDDATSEEQQMLQRVLTSEDLDIQFESAINDLMTQPGLRPLKEMPPLTRVPIVDDFGRSGTLIEEDKQVAAVARHLNKCIEEPEQTMGQNKKLTSTVSRIRAKLFAMRAIATTI